MNVAAAPIGADSKIRQARVHVATELADVFANTLSPAVVAGVEILALFAAEPQHDLACRDLLLRTFDAIDEAMDVARGHLDILTGDSE